jgi:hypothetical protein
MGRDVGKSNVGFPHNMALSMASIAIIFLLA